jgi:hypothetical protein
LVVEGHIRRVDLPKHGDFIAFQGYMLLILAAFAGAHQWPQVLIFLIEPPVEFDHDDNGRY